MTETLRVKIASEPFEFDQIHALNHKTFVEEIPRYAAVPSRLLVDRFHPENTYVVGLRGRQLAGMVAIRHTRPFSLDERLGNLDTYLPPGRSVCELRLLAVEARERRGRVLPALLAATWQYCREQRYDLAVISAFTRQRRLYEHLGFVPFGPVIGTEPAAFQPMMLTLERFRPRADVLFGRA
jgi:GNAT superfamily N-acetyltransferase